MTKKRLLKFSIHSPHFYRFIRWAWYNEIFLLRKRNFQYWTWMCFHCFIFSVYWIFPYFYLTIFSAWDDFTWICSKNDIINRTFVANKFKRSYLRFKAPNFDNTISSSWNNLFHFFWKIDCRNSILMSSETSYKTWIFSCCNSSDKPFGLFHFQL